MAIPDSKLFKMYVSVCVSGYARGEYSLTSYNRSEHSPEWRMIDTVEVPVIISKLDLDVLEMEGLEAALKKERAESQSRQNILLDRISKLKSIGHEVTDDV